MLVVRVPFIALEVVYRSDTACNKLIPIYFHVGFSIAYTYHQLSKYGAQINHHPVSF